MRGFDREQRGTSPNEDERAVMSSWRFGHITAETAIERLGGSDRFNELLTPRERRVRKAAKA